MTPTIDSLSAGFTWSPDRGGYAPPAVVPRRGGRGRVDAVGDATSFAGAARTEDLLLEAPDYQALSATGVRRSQPADLLMALIERMGGTAASRWKGMYVNLVV